MSHMHEMLMDNSLQAALSSIEIYNKPDFKYREQTFAVLNVNAWELLLKAKILKDAGDNLTSLYVPLPNGGYKTNRSGNPLTIDITAAINRLALDRAAVENVASLIEIRDTAMHFYCSSSLSYVVYTLGAASLQNYQKLVKEWFGRSLLEYNFYILPLGFAYNFQTLSLLQVETEPEIISNLIKTVAATRSTIDQSGEFYFVCEVTTQIRSAKKFVGDADFTTLIDSSLNPDTPVIIQMQRLIDKYPVSYNELLAQVRKAKPGVKQHQVDKVIREHKLKNNPKYSTYSFTSKQQETKHMATGAEPKGISSLYNQDAVRFVIEHIEV